MISWVYFSQTPFFISKRVTPSAFLFASAFLRHLPQVGLGFGARTDGVLLRVTFSLSRAAEGQQADSGLKPGSNPGRLSRMKQCVGNGARWWLLTFHKYAAGDKTQTLSRCRRTGKLLGVRRGGMNSDVVCILMCCFLFTANHLHPPSGPCRALHTTDSPSGWTAFYLGFIFIYLLVKLNVVFVLKAGRECNKPRFQFSDWMCNNQSSCPTSPLGV